MNPRLFGCSVSMAESVLVVGTPSVGSKGCVHTYKVSDRQCVEAAPPLFPSDGHVDDGFGISCKLVVVSPVEMRLIVGSHRKTVDGISSGVAYIYSSKDTGLSWDFVCQLAPSVKIHKSFFGCSVDMTATKAVVGAYGDNTEGYRVGSACIYEETTPGKWEFVRSLYPNTFSKKASPTCSYFGFSVALTGRFVAIGAPSERSSGCVYIFYAQEDSWHSTILSHCIEGENRFGFSVNIHDDSLVAGAPGDNGLPGKACVYKMSAFYDAALGFVPASQSKDAIYCETIRTKSKSSRALFGRSVALHDKYVLVSGFGQTTEQDFVGSAFLYLKGEAGEVEPIACLRDSDATELFGHHVAMTGDYIAIGDPTSDKVHIYVVNHLMGSYLKKWYGSAHTISPPQRYALEIH